jgi:hypothetical protein
MCPPVLYFNDLTPYHGNKRIFSDTHLALQ